MYKTLAIDSKNHRILCGDFNSPKEETFHGEIITWAQNLKRDGSLAIVKGKRRWEAGERLIMEGLTYFDLKDVFRVLYGYEVKEYSFTLKYKDKVFRRRFDHCFGSSSLNPIVMKYLHQFREEKLSDHSPLILTFQSENVSSN